MYYDKEGKRISLNEYANLMENFTYRNIGKTYIGKYEISTVWMGLDHNFYSENEEDKLIFETMIFCEDKEDEHNHWIERYGTLEEALKGHKEAENLIEGKQMKKDEMLHMMDMLKSMFEMKEEIENLSSKLEEGEENPNNCPLACSLEKEYNEIISWSLGNYRFTPCKKGKAIEIWQSLHPDLPIPRVLKSSITDQIVNTLGLLIDIIPLYHEDKKRKCKCANAS